LIREYRLTEQARQDVHAIREHIAENSETAPDLFMDLLTSKFSLLAENPYTGRRRDDLRRG